MCAGTGGRGTDHCAHIARSFDSYARFRKMPHARTYIDIVGAFDAVCRELLWEAADDAHVCFVLARLNFPPESIDEIKNFVSSAAVLERCGVPDPLIRAVRDSHEESWFTA
eukprot:5409933-Alexandrium_andersonii.AAC.1